MTAALGEPAAGHADGAWWHHARQLTPGRRLRLADPDTATGGWRNSYSRTIPATGPAPTAPVALHLAGRNGRYTLLAWDLDASRGPVAEDLNQLCDWLSTVRIEHVVCASGPSGGRHVWVALTAGGVDADTVSTMATAMATQVPTLDISPLTNPATGAVRPPGAPHRAGGTSTILRGDIARLLHPSTTEDDIHALLDLVGLPTTTPPTQIHRRNTLHDSDGHPHLAGPRRPLPTVCHAALETPLTGGQDASARAWVILLGAVRARWRHQDIADLVDDVNASPGLEHLRSSPHGPASRQPRASEDRRQLIARQWARAVDHITQTSDLPSDTDPSWDHRVTRVLDAVRRTQLRADASPGRWSRPGGAADRRVLDHACAITLTALRDDVALDIRSTALATGLSRETARYALVRLRTDGWIDQRAGAHAKNAATWRLPAFSAIAEDPLEPTENAPLASSTGELDHGRPHVDPPPDPGNSPPPPAAACLTRQAWLTRLGTRLSAQAHDIWLPRRWGGLGHEVGRTYALLEGLGTTEIDTLAHVSGNR